MARERGRLRDARRAELRQKLIDAMESLLAEGADYAVLKPEAIAERAGVSRATFYVHFDGKTGLLAEWIQGAVEDLRRSTSGLGGLSVGSTAADLREAIAPTIDAWRDRALLLAATQVEAGQDSLLRDELESVLDEAVAGVDRGLRRGQREGWVDPELLPSETAAWLLSMVERGLGAIAVDAPPAEVQELTTTLAALLWAAVAVPAPR